MWILTIILLQLALGTFLTAATTSGRFIPTIEYSMFQTPIGSDVFRKDPDWRRRSSRIFDSRYLPRRSTTDHISSSRSDPLLYIVDVLQGFPEMFGVKRW
jgi:hypothetical protein